MKISKWADAVVNVHVMNRAWQQEEKNKLTALACRSFIKHRKFYKLTIRLSAVWSRYYSPQLFPNCTFGSTGGEMKTNREQGVAVMICLKCFYSAFFSPLELEHTFFSPRMLESFHRVGSFEQNLSDSKRWIVHKCGVFVFCFCLLKCYLNAA